MAPELYFLCLSPCLCLRSVWKSLDNKVLDLFYRCCLSSSCLRDLSVGSDTDRRDYSIHLQPRVHVFHVFCVFFRQPAASLLMLVCDWLLGCSLHPSRPHLPPRCLFFYRVFGSDCPTLSPSVAVRRVRSRSRSTARGGTAGWPRPVWSRRPLCPAGPEPSRSRTHWRGCCAASRRWSRTARSQPPGGSQHLTHSFPRPVGGAR